MNPDTLVSPRNPNIAYTRLGGGDTPAEWTQFHNPYTTLSPTELGTTIMNISPNDVFQYPIGLVRAARETIKNTIYNILQTNPTKTIFNFHRFSVEERSILYPIFAELNLRYIKQRSLDLSVYNIHVLAGHRNRNFANSQTGCLNICPDMNILFHHTNPRMVKDEISDILLVHSDKTTFNFNEFERQERSLIYKALAELNLPFTKNYGRSPEINHGVISIQVNILPNTNRFATRNVQGATNTGSYSRTLPVVPFTPTPPRTLAAPPNMEHKLKLSDYIFDIKDTMTDTMFKDMMDTLAKIK